MRKFFVPVIIFLFAGFAAAQYLITGYSLDGKKLNDSLAITISLNGKPVANASVDVLLNGKNVLKGNTDTAGQIVIQLSAPGIYQIFSTYLDKKGTKFIGEDKFFFYIERKINVTLKEGVYTVCTEPISPRLITVYNNEIRVWQTDQDGCKTFAAQKKDILVEVREKNFIKKASVILKAANSKGGTAVIEENTGKNNTNNGYNNPTDQNTNNGYNNPTDQNTNNGYNTGKTQTDKNSDKSINLTDRDAIISNKDKIVVKLKRTGQKNGFKLKQLTFPGLLAGVLLLGVALLLLFKRRSRPKMFALLLVFVCVGFVQAKDVDLNVEGFEADTEADSIMLEGPGSYELELTLKNNLPIGETKKKIDLMFVLDASKSMQDEINAVRDSIKTIIDTINEDANGLLKVGIYVFEGKGSRSGFEEKHYCGFTEDRGLIPLTEDGLLLKQRLSQIITVGWIEPWAKLVEEILEDDSVGWRAPSTAVKVMIVISDEGADKCGSEGRCFGCSQAIQALNSKDAWFFGIWNKFDYYAEHDENAREDMTQISNNTKGKIFQYTNTDDIPKRIIEAISTVLGSDDFEVKREGENWDNLDAILSNSPVPQIPRNGGTWSQIIGLTAPPYSSGPKIVPIRYFATLKTTNETDNAWVKIFYQQAPVAKLTVTPSQGVAPLTVVADASESYDPDFDPITFSWDFDGQEVKDKKKVLMKYTSKGKKTISLTLSDGQETTTVTKYVNLTEQFSLTDLIIKYDTATGKLSLKANATKDVKIKFFLKNTNGKKIKINGKTEWNSTANADFKEIGLLTEPGLYLVNVEILPAFQNNCQRCRITKNLLISRELEKIVPDNSLVSLLLVLILVLSIIQTKKRH